jgi:hypothetical protein
LKWLQCVLVLARDRFPAAGYETTRPGEPSADAAMPQELLAGIEKLLGNSLETLGSSLEKAIARVKPRKPASREVTA